MEDRNDSVGFRECGLSHRQFWGLGENHSASFTVRIDVNSSVDYWSSNSKFIRWPERKTLIGIRSPGILFCST